MKNSHSYKLTLGRAVMVSAIALIGFATTAQAGFEWRGPLEPPTPPAAQIVPAPAVTDDLPAPVTSWDGVTSAAPVAVAPVDPAAPSPALAPFVAATPLPEPVEAGDVLSGFGSDLPLVIALQQVVPAGYQYSFAEGVHLGQPVSWEGGKPWQHVLSDMLAKEGLGYRLQNNVVVVGYFPPEEAAPAVNMMDAPAAAEAPVTWTEPAPAASAPAPQAGEPVTIRRQKPGRAAAAPAPAAEAAEDMSAPVTATSAPAWQSSTDRTAGQSARAMSYPPAKSSTAPIAVTSAPPAAQNKISAPEYSAQEPLSVPPPMDMGVMSQDPPADDKPVDLTALDAAVAEMAVEAAPAPAVTEAAPAQVPAKAPVVAGKGDWSGQKGDTLRETLKNWSDSAGVELYWSIDYDYRLKKNVTLDGSYDQAVATLLDQFADVRPQPYGQLHQGKDGPRVLVVRSYDLTP